MSTKSGIKICLTLQNTQVDKTYTVHTYLFSQILFGFEISFGVIKQAYIWHKCNTINKNKNR